MRAVTRPAAALGLLAAAYALPAVTTWPALRRRLSPALHGTGDPARVALTFDDGPHPMSTPHFLRLLAGRDLHATFFLLGRQVAGHPVLAKEIAAAGHEIAVHGYEHRCLLWRDPRGTYDDLARARDTIAAATGEVPRWYRPPYGVLTAGALWAAHRLELTPVLWSAWGRDWSARATPSSVYRTVVRDLTGGGTVLLHDSDVTSAPGSWHATLGALPALLEHCRTRGLAVGPLRAHRSAG